MKTFIRIAEVWTPTEDGASLVLSSGLFPGASAFEAITRQMIFARGEGLPGRAWEAGHPLMMRELSGGYFQRAAAARAIDLSCAVACPVYRGDVLQCVVVLLMGGPASSVGSVELWQHDPRLSSDMTLVEGYFGTGPAAAQLEALTRDGWLPRGAGAPGLAWQKEEAVCIPDIATSKHFLRKEAALNAGIGRALALPCSVRGTGTWVLAMLSSPVTPITLRVEIWTAPAGQGDTLVRSSGYCEGAGPLSTGTATAHKLEALGAIGDAWRTAVAQASQSLPTAGTAAEQSGLTASGAQSVLALPVLVNDAVSEVVALYF
ncbi:hypothetical protein [Hydrogenophaga sp. MI9]|uniref:hypothetical protein n=1 Tax=Hydrogenophaga sp. MI9 TaxID=3453719 RepID=UPI003EEF6A52